MEQLAIRGGPPACPQGPPPWPPRDPAVEAALRQVYADGDWGRYHGAQCASLAGELAEFHVTEHVTLCCSGTIAVELALRGLGVGPGDEVMLAAYDFPGNFRAIEAAGARPVLVDVDPRDWNLDAAGLSAALQSNCKALIVSHLHGGVVPMRELMEFAAAHGLAVVEDACQAAGGMVEGRRAGVWGHAGVLSFGGSKLLTAGRGGAVLTADAAIHQRIKVYSDRGNQAFPLSELQAAVLRPQLQQLPQRNARRLAAVDRLVAALSGAPQVVPLPCRAPDSQPAYYKLGLQYHGAEDGPTREEFLAAVQAEGVALDAGFRGFAGRGPRRCRKAGDLQHARAAAERMMVLHHPVLLESDETIDQVAAAITKVARGLG